MRVTLLHSVVRDRVVQVDIRPDVRVFVYSNLAASGPVDVEQPGAGVWTPPCWRLDAKTALMLEDMGLIAIAVARGFRAFEEHWGRR